MTFKDLQKWLNSVQGNSSIASQEENNRRLYSERFKVFRDKLFWINDINEHKHQDILHKGACCFNHIIGLPRKDSVEKPIFDYEVNLTKAFDTYNDIWIKKARGLGITEILLRYISSHNILAVSIF